MNTTPVATAPIQTKTACNWSAPFDIDSQRNSEERMIRDAALSNEI